MIYEVFSNLKNGLTLYIQVMFNVCINILKWKKPRFKTNFSTIYTIINKYTKYIQIYNIYTSIL